MEENVKKPLNLQFFADEASEQPEADTEKAKTESETVQTDIKKIIASDPTAQAQFDKMVQKALNTAKTNWEKEQKPNQDAAQRLEQVEAKYTARMIAAEMRAVGLEYGLLDANDAMRLVDTTAFEVSDDGTVTGVKEAIEALKTSKPYLFKVAEAAPTGQKKDVGGKVATATAETTLDQFKRMGYPARVEMKKSNPTLYNTLTEQERNASATGKK